MHSAHAADIPAARIIPAARVPLTARHTVPADRPGRLVTHRQIIRAAPGDPASTGGASPATVDEVLAAVRSTGWAVLRGTSLLRHGRPDVDAVLRMARRFGQPSARDGGTAVWRIAPRSTDPRATFSIRSGPAALHTDSQYHTRPEPLVCMVMVRPAASGGLLRLLRTHDAVSALDGCAGRDEALALLRESRWRWDVPAAFAEGANAAADPGSGSPESGSPESGTGASGHAVLGGDGTMRWRSDNLRRPLPKPQAWAAKLFADRIEQAAGVTEVALAPGDVVLVDNLRVLHGRTSFSDPARLLLRVRLWQS